MCPMTTRQKAHRLLDVLSDEDLVLELPGLRATVDGGRRLDDRDDLDRYGARASLEGPRHMTGDEDAAGFSWER